ncbi:MAG: hypothetical protein AAFR55_06305 [Pseudomonadota bacterium]
MMRQQRERVLKSAVRRPGVFEAGRAAAAALLVASVGVTAAATSAAATDAASLFQGSWQGKGEVAFSDGRAEAIACRSYVTSRDELLRMALRCASPSYKVEVRSSLKITGEVVEGTWEERNFNAQGDVSGALKDQTLVLQVEGGGISGDMTIARDDDTLSYDIKTGGMAISRVAVELKPIR